jgi:hypothetical protein
MSIFEIFEVGIGVVFIWVLLSLASMAIQEWVAAIFKLRSRDLENHVRNILRDPQEKWLNRDQFLNKTVKGLINLFRRLLRRSVYPVLPQVRIKLAEEIYQHPLIKALSKEGGKPSYIPDRAFSLALFDILVTAGTDGSLIQRELKKWEQAVDEKQLPPKTLAAIEIQMLEVNKIILDYAGKPEFRIKVEAAFENMLTQLTGEHPELESSLEELQKMLPGMLEIGMTELLSGINHIWHDNPDVARVMTSFYRDASDKVQLVEEQLSEMRTNIETWFNDSMERLSGWYKRRAQLIGIGIGFTIAILFNVDTIAIGEALWREPVVRSALVARAEEFEIPDVTAEVGVAGKDPESAWNEFYTQFRGMSLPFGWAYDDTPCFETSGGTPGLKNLVFRFNNQCYKPVDVSGEPESSWGVFWIKIMGWVVSGAASGQGATYWFDILKRLINVRSSGKKPNEGKSK